MKRMKAAVLEVQGEALQIRSDLEIQAPGPGQVRVRVSNCGVCHSDLSLVDGAFPSPLPVILGHEAAGVVESVGAGVDSPAPGDHVVLTPCPPCGGCYWCLRSEQSLCVNSRGIQTSTFLDGSTGLSRAGERVFRGVNLAAFSEFVVAPASGAVPIPREVPLEVACVIGCAVQTGVGAVLNTAGVEEGATVLVAGLGGIGLSVVQGARVAGASRILASDPLAERRDAAKGFGATHLLDPTHEDVVKRALEICEVGVDYAFETAGRGGVIETCLAATRLGGTTVCVGAPPLADALSIAPIAAFVLSGKHVVGCVLGSSNSLREIPRLVALWQAGRLDLEGLITARRPLSEINLALDDLRAGRGIRTVLSI